MSDALPVVPELVVLLEHLDRNRAVTLEVLRLIPEGMINWRPSDGLRSFGQHLVHVAKTEEFYIHGLFEGSWNSYNVVEGGRPGRDVIRKRLRESRWSTLKKLREANKRDLWTVPSVPNLPVQWPVISWLWYLVEHEVHHKAQIFIYLREIGIEPPFFAYPLPPGLRPDRASSG